MKILACNGFHDDFKLKQPHEFESRTVLLKLSLLLNVMLQSSIVYYNLPKEHNSIPKSVSKRINVYKL